jgi:hypothetical protein
LSLFLFSEKIYQHREDNTQDDGCSQGEVEGEVLPADKDVPGQTTQPGDLRRNEKKQTDSEKYSAEDEEEFGEGVHELSPKRG